MTSIERTAYPRFGRVVSAGELDALCPLADEVEWARQRSRSDEHLLGLVLGLKCFQRLGYYPRDDQLPEADVERIRASLGLPGGIVRDARDRTARWQQELVRYFERAYCRFRAYLGWTPNPAAGHADSPPTHSARRD